MIRRTFLLFFLLAFTACDDDGTGVDTPVRYALQMVNGANLPTNHARAGRTVLVLSGFLEMTSDNTFAFRMTYSETVAGQTQTTSGGVPGTWTRTGDTFTLTFIDGSPSTAAIDGDRITWTFDGSTFVLVK